MLHVWYIFLHLARQVYDNYGTCSKVPMVVVCLFNPFQDPFLWPTKIRTVVSGQLAKTRSEGDPQQNEEGDQNSWPNYSSY